MKNSTTDKLKKIIPFVFSLFLIFFLWIILARKVNSALIIPGPQEVFVQILNLLGSGLFWKNFLYTLSRVLLSFGITVILGVIIGYACSKSRFFNDFFKIPLAIIRVTPVISVILLVSFWLKSSTVPVAVTVLMTLPLMITSIIKGGMVKNSELMNMAECFNYTRTQKFFYIELETLKPFFWAGCVSVFGLCWKVVVAGEVLSLPKNGIGVLIQKSQVHLESSMVMAYTILLVGASFIMELIFTESVKRRFNNV